MNPNAVMIDIEALSLQPNAYILQVGVVIADLEAAKVIGTNVFSIAGQDGRHIDYDTVKWWMQQDRSVALDVFDVKRARAAITQDEAYAFLEGVSAGATVWSNPSTYDLVVLKDLFGGKTPWSHRQGMCLKTAVAILDPDGKHKPVDNDRPHDALADALWQTSYLMRLYELAHPGVTQG